MDLAAILSTLGIKPNPSMLPSQDWKGLPPSPIPVATNDMTRAQPVPQPIMLGPGSPSARAPLPFGTEQGNTITGLPAAPAPNAPMQQIPFPQDSYRFPPPTDQGPTNWPGGMPESGLMKQAMLMIQAALDPDSVAAKADAAGIPPPDLSPRTGPNWPGTGAGPASPPTNWPGTGAAPSPLPVPAVTPPELGPELAGSLISKPAQATAEQAAASQPVVPLPVMKPPVPGAPQTGEVTPPPATPAQSAAANLKKTLSGVKQPDGAGGKKGVGSAGVVAPKDFDSVAAMLAQVLSGQAAPQPAKLPFL